MKIIHFIYAIGLGGAEHIVVDLANEQAKDNEVHLYALRDDTEGNKGFYKAEISKKVSYVNLRISPGFKPRLIWTFYKILKAEKPEIVHCHLNLVNYFFLLSIFFRRKIRIVYTLHSSARFEVGSNLERLIRRFFYKYGFITPVANSDENKKSYTSFFKLNNIRVIYNGIKTTEQTDDYERVVKEIAGLKPNPGTLVFCHIGRYSSEKNQKMLISVFNKLYDEGVDAILLVIGSDFETAVELTVKAKDNIHFIGIVPDVHDYLIASDAFCLSSVDEGMPISLIEAFACGCTPICTPVGGIVNTIEHGVTGFLSKSVSERDYRKAINQYIKNRNSIDNKKLISHYRENFSIEKCAISYMDVYLGK